MPDNAQHRDAPLADQSSNIRPDANVLVQPGFGLDTTKPGGLYIGQNNATSLIHGKDGARGPQGAPAAKPSPEEMTEIVRRLLLEGLSHG